MSYDAWKELETWMKSLLSSLPPDNGDYDIEEDEDEDEDESESET